MRSTIRSLVASLSPLDPLEAEHREYVLRWIDSGAGLFRTAKPATPDPHLVSYFAVVDPDARKLLLVDHRLAGLWLPSGGHVEPDEHPRATVEREAMEELNLVAEFLLEEPLLLTVTETVGQTAGHTDVSLWYVLRGDASAPLRHDEGEFAAVRWFAPEEIPSDRVEPHLPRFIRKLERVWG